MDRAEKHELVARMNAVFSDAASVVVVHYDGLSVAEMTDLRGRLRDAGASFKVTKNRLTRLALNGTDYEGIQGLFTGPTGVGFAADPVAAPKAISAFAKENEKLRILGGGMGATVLDVEGVKALANMPSLDELRGKLLGLLNAPAQKLAQITQEPGAQLARVLNAYATKDAA